MSFQLIKETWPRARKEHRCIWCHEQIVPGEVHCHSVSTYCGDFQYMRLHRECCEAASEFVKNSRDDEFDPGSFKRGTCEER